jgi:hypothetical protein
MRISGGAAPRPQGRRLLATQCNLANQRACGKARLADMERHNGVRVGGHHVRARGDERSMRRLHRLGRLRAPR